MHFQQLLRAQKPLQELEPLRQVLQQLLEPLQLVPLRLEPLRLQLQQLVLPQLNQFIRFEQLLDHHHRLLKDPLILQRSAE